MQMIMNLNSDKPWEETGIFPRVTWCYLKVWSTATQLQFGVQCVLPANFINEKIYIFLWFWLVFVFAVTVYSIGRWFIKLALPSQRTAFVMNLLKQAFPDMKNENSVRRLRGRFVDRYLRPDGVFILHLISSKSTEVIACDIVQHLWCCYANSHLNRTNNASGHGTDTTTLIFRNENQFAESAGQSEIGDHKHD